MSDQENNRFVTLNRVGKGKFEVTNVRGGTITTGMGEDADFQPGELLLAAIASCTGVDLDLITSRRAELTSFRIRIDAVKMSDEQGSHLGDIHVTYDATYPDGADADAAREVLPQALKRSRERLCTVGRTVEIGTPITDELAALPD